MRGHAFSLLGVNEFIHNGKQIRLCKIRNPWGQFEWKGAWSDKSSEWTPELDAMLNHTDEDDGIFFMTFDDYLGAYHQTVICCNPNPKMYTHQKRMVDFNTSEFPNVAFLRVDLAADVELTEETFGISCFQQGNILANSNRHNTPLEKAFIEVLVFDSHN